MKPKNLLSQNPICFDCQKELENDFKRYIVEEDFTKKIDGNDIDFPKGAYFCKCNECYEKEPKLLYQETEIYARIVGYIRPKNQWNVGKIEEDKDRKLFKIK